MVSFLIKCLTDTLYNLSGKKNKVILKITNNTKIISEHLCLKAVKIKMEVPMYSSHCMRL